jgi:hypothetical protein
MMRPPARAYLTRRRHVPPQIWRIVSGAAPAGGGWRNHPATRAWEGHADALARYANACVDEWTRRGFVNNMPRLEQRAPEAPQLPWCAQRARSDEELLVAPAGAARSAGSRDGCLLRGCAASQVGRLHAFSLVAPREPAAQRS